MNTSHANSEVRFFGKTDQDTNLRDMRPGDYFDSLNIRNGMGAERGAVSNIKGNDSVAYTLGTGRNKCVGFEEDKRCRTGVYFIWNEFGDHRLVRYFIEDGTIHELMKGSLLDFDEDRYIQARIVDGKFLYWTDSFADKNSLTGSVNKKINMEKADKTGKLLCWEFVLGVDANATGASWDINTTEFDGTPILPVQTLYTVPAGPPTLQAVIDALIIAFDGIGFDATQCGERTLEVCARSTNVIAYVVPAGAPQPISRWIASNFYSDIFITTEMLDIRKPLPKTYPVPRMVNDTSVLQNKIFGFNFQFRYRILFDDGETSEWGPVSYVPTNFWFVDDPYVAASFVTDNAERFTKITLDFLETIIDSQYWRNFAKRIEIAVRYGQDEVWKSVDVLNLNDLEPGNMEYDFLNDGSYTVIPSTDSSSGDVQNIKQFSFSPRISSSLEVIHEDDDTYKLALSGNLEDYDMPECPEADIQLVSFLYPNTIGAGDQTSERKFLKKGGVYNIGIVYYDLHRKSPVQHLGQIRVPYDRDNWYYPTIQMTTPAPSWAIGFKYVISKEQVRSQYVQFPAWIVKNWIIDPDDPSNNSATTFGAGDATHIGFSFSIEDLSDDKLNFLFEEQNRDKVFIPALGDRLQLIKSFPNQLAANTLINPANWDVHNYKVAGYNLTYPIPGSAAPDRFTVYIENDQSLNVENTDGVDGYFVVEIYRPNSVDDKIYYDFSDYEDIVNHGNVISVQDRGDTYAVDRYYYNGIGPVGLQGYDIAPEVERPNLHRLTDITGWDWGLPNIEDPNFQERFKSSSVRTSDSYIPNGSINGLSSFRALDYITLNRDFGPIQATRLVDSVFLAICSYKSQSIYVGRDEAIDRSGGVLTTRTDRLLNIAKESRYDLGTLNPESVCVNQGVLYAYDEYSGKVWRYTTGNGQNPIVRGREIFFRDLAKSRIAGNRQTSKVYGGFQEEFKTYYLTFDTQFTIGFKEDGENSGWSGNYSWIPEMHGAIGLQYLTIKDGTLWLHESDAVDYNNFYGVQYDSNVVAVWAPEGSMVKIPWNVQEQADSLWSLPLIEVEPTDSYPGGMESRLKANRWHLYEGQYWADFLRDYTDPAQEFSTIVPADLKATTALLKGRVLRGSAMKLTFQLEDSTILSKLRLAKIQFTPSQSTQ